MLMNQRATRVLTPCLLTLTQFNILDDCCPLSGKCPLLRALHLNAFAIMSILINHVTLVYSEEALSDILIFADKMLYDHFLSFPFPCSVCMSKLAQPRQQIGSWKSFHEGHKFCDWYNPPCYQKFTICLLQIQWMPNEWSFSNKFIKQ